MTEKQKKITVLAKKVSDTYEDFIDGLPIDAKRIGKEDEVISFMEENPEATSSDILEYVTKIDDTLPKWDEEKKRFIIK